MMQKHLSRFVLCALSVIAAACDDPDAIADQPLALIYKGPGSCRTEDGDAGRSGYGCSEAAADAAALAGFRFRYVGPKELTSRSTDEEVRRLFSGGRVWIQPGGVSNLAYGAMTARLRGAIVDFVAEGGGYVGFCAGAFLGTDGFDLMPGESTLLDYRPARRGLGFTFLPVDWNGVRRSMYFEGGPYLSYLGSSVEVTARYSNGRVAAARTRYREGRVYLSGPHPEAPEIWPEEDGIQDPDGSDLALAAEMITWAGLPGDADAAPNDRTRRRRSRNRSN